ncbi:sterol regulatory element-binding protein cleavage-activating protein [Zymoseptoria brevis]|uniref:Sterol regulatory element-binding protein cleavage-activating protein n=1 Tax=Zymoseptoria brevis TaxID=1047168 RepID=A0A0F4GEK2_9PEZI|nr:sterol regulatory element-binding protein cleavage-activating protein [Zymoseptoria brevis]
MLVAVAIAMAFSYPSVAFHENASTGLSAIAHQVWTTAKPLEDGHSAVDVEMRQIWIHGSFMNALDKSVLKQALRIQQSLVGDEPSSSFADASHVEARPDVLDRGYHSPLMYWNDSESIIDADANVLKTINEQKYALTSLGVSLRPATVLAGKKFDKDVVIAADALVITLMNHFEDDAGKEWHGKLQNLKQAVCQDCLIFPGNGQMEHDRVYELSLKPLSLREHSALALAYGCMALYVLISLRRMRAFHSRFGLVVTAITQMTCSILASFTICGILKINLSTIPHNAYPFVVLVFGVENMFRLINAVLAYPPTMATDNRVANALGDIGPISVAAAVQNMIILSILSTLVTPGVAAFCAFAAIATLFDAFFLLTFFVAVLNVDIHRLELQDALAARHNQPRTGHRRRPSPSKNTWFDALVHGKLPFSTRMAGTVVTTTFILSLNYHFSEHRDHSTNLRQFLGLERGRSPVAAGTDPFPAPPMNATLSPGEWMRMQELETAKEVIKLAKPGANSLVVRVFTPLIIVLGGSDRSGASEADEALSYALQRFAKYHLYPVAVAVVFIVAFVFILMNFLLYNQAGDEDHDIAMEQMEDQLTVQHVALPHKLDIVKLINSRGGHFVTVGLDRTIAISVKDNTQQTHRIISVPSNVTGNIAWPVRHVAIDDNGEWVACHGADDRVLVYNSATGSFLSRVIQYPDDHPALIFDFVPLPVTAGTKLHLIVLSSAGRLAQSCLEDGTSSGADLSTISLVGASTFESAASGRKLYTITEDGRAVSFSWIGSNWVQSTAQKLEMDAAQESRGPVSLQLNTELETEFLIVKTSKSALFLNSTTLGHITRFDFNDSGAINDRLFVEDPRTCHGCGNIAMRRITWSSESVKAGWCNLCIFTSSEHNEGHMCLSNSTSVCRPVGGVLRDKLDLSQPGNHAITMQCRPLGSAVKARLICTTPGTWAMVDSQTVLGIRRRQHDNEQPTSSSTATAGRGLSIHQPRQRRNARSTSHDQKAQDERWEVYKLSPNGTDDEIETLELPHTSDGASGDDTELYVTNPGPIVALDTQAVAVAFGNTVKVIRVARRSAWTRRSAEGLEPWASDARASGTERRGR